MDFYPDFMVVIVPKVEHCTIFELIFSKVAPFPSLNAPPQGTTLEKKDGKKVRPWKKDKNNLICDIVFLYYEV